MKLSELIEKIGEIEHCEHIILDAIGIDIIKEYLEMYEERK